MADRKTKISTVLSDDILCLVPLNGGIIRSKLKTEEFSYTVETDECKALINFPASWPGDILFAFKSWCEKCRLDSDIIPGTFVIMHKCTKTAVGVIGTKTDCFLQDSIEIGYGILPDSWGKGYATRALQLLCSWLFSLPNIKLITAETSQSNAASQRVLEKCRFIKTDTGQSEEDGTLFLWSKNK